MNFFEADGTTPANLAIVSANSGDTDHQRINETETGYPSDCTAGEIIFYDDGYTISGDTFTSEGTSNLQTSPAATVDPNGVHYSNDTKLTQEDMNDNYYLFAGSGAGVDGFVYTFDGASDTNTSCAGGEHSASNQRNIFALELAEPTGQSISGTVFNDDDALNDNTVDGTGIGSPSSTPLYANLLDSSGNVVATTTINADGTYNFSGIADGTYTVQVTTNQGTVGSAAPATELPTGWINTGENTGATAGNDGTPDGQQSVTVNGADVTEVNFGIQEAATISGSVKDSDGAGISGVTLTLMESDGVTPVKDASGNDITATTDGSGNYTFSDIPSGEYVIVETQPTGYNNVSDAQSADNDTTANTNTTDDQIPVTVVAGEDDLNNNFVEELITSPISLLSFNAKLNGNNVDLAWVTATEESNEKFVVEYSLNGKEFSVLTEVAGQGTKLSQTNYTLTHQDVALLGAEQVYYKLAQVDYDGTKTYVGRIQTVLFTQVDGLVAYPNPAQIGQPIVIAGVNGNGAYEVYNVQGQLQFRADNSASVVTIDSSSLTAGMYIIQFANGQTVKLIVK